MSVNQSGNTGKIAAASPHARMIKWAVIAFFVAVAAIVVMNLPRGFSDDLSRVGKGKPAVVLVRDKNLTQSFDLMNVVDSVRSQYDGRVEFLLTDFDTEQGREFMQANKAARANLVLFDAAGNAVKVLAAPQTAESVKQEIAAISGGAP